MGLTVSKSEEKKKAQNNGVFNLPLPLREIIQGYLQYEDALKICQFLELSEPQRPIFYLDQIDFIADLDKRRSDKTGHDAYYIEHKEGVSMALIHFEMLVSLSQHCKIYWRCPSCKSWVLLHLRKFKYVFSEYILVGGWGLRAQGHRDKFCLCYCGVAQFTKDGKLKQEIQEKTVYCSIFNNELQNVFAIMQLKLIWMEEGTRKE